MPPARKRKIRLVVALSAAVVLACALVFTSLSASSEAVTPSQLAGATAGASYQLTGKVVDGSIRNIDGGVSFLALPPIAGRVASTLGVHGAED